VAGAAAPPQVLKIKLRAYSAAPLEESVDEIRAAAAATGATVSLARLPTRRSIYCVLRSPHVNKDSREHFEIRTHQRYLHVGNLSSSTVDKLVSLDLPAGVDVRVRV